MMTNKYHDNLYLDLVEYTLTHGQWRANRTSVPTKSEFGMRMKFDLRDGTIPLLTTKKMHLRSVIHELLWYLMGDSNVKYLHDNNVTIWDEWIDENGDLGPVYGVQWRKWNTGRVKWISSSESEPIYIDQIAELIHNLKTDPMSRRLMVNAWNVGELELMHLPPCHYGFQCYARELKEIERREIGFRCGFGDLLTQDNMTWYKSVDDMFEDRGIPKYELSLMLNQRSCDVGLGVPFNIVQYSILLRMLAEVVGMVPGDFIWNGGDVHIYENHIDPLKEQLTREPYASPKLHFARSIKDIDDFKFEDFIITDYKSHDTIKMPVAK